MRYWSFQAIESHDKNSDGEKSNENENEKKYAYEWIRLEQRSEIKNIVLKQVANDNRQVDQTDQQRHQKNNHITKVYVN